MPGDRVPVVFIHGLWLHSTSWEPWAEMFRAAGYEPVLPEWPGIGFEGKASLIRVMRELAE